MPVFINHPSSVYRSYALYMVLALLGLVAMLLPRGIVAHTDACVWSGSVSTDWFRKDNWDSCDDGIPQSHDDVEISGGERPPLLHRSTIVKTVTLSGQQLNIINGAVLNASAFRAAGAVIHLNGTIKAPMTFGTGITTVNATGTLDGPIAIGGIADPLATLDVEDGSAILATSDITIHGALSTGSALGKPGGTGILLFEGAQLTNNGTMREQITFQRDGVQTIRGTGNWQNIPRLMITGGSRTTLGNPITLATAGLDVTNRGILALGVHTLTLSDTPRLKVEMESAIDGSGIVRTVTDMVLGVDGTITPTVELVAPTTVTVTGAGLFAGNLLVARDALLTVEGAPAANGEIGLNGTMAGPGNLVYRGPSFTNNGSVAVPFVTFDGSVQTLQGSGDFSATTQVRITGQARLSLGSDHRIGKLLVTAGGTLDITNRTLSLSGTPVPLVRAGTIITAGSTVVYGASAPQTVTAGGTSYHNLTLRNEQGTVADVLPLQVRGLLSVERGSFTIGTTESHDVQIAAGGILVARPNSVLDVHGSWTNNGTFTPGDRSTVRTSGTGVQEIGGSTTTAFENLTISGVQSMLKTDAEVKRKLTLEANLDTGDERLTLLPEATTAGNGDVIGAVRRAGPLAPEVVYGLGNPDVMLMFDGPGTLPSEITMTLALEEPSSPNLAVRRTYTLDMADGLIHSARLRLHYRDAEVSRQPENGLYLWHRNDAAHPWSYQGRTAIDTTQNWVELTGALVGSGEWALGSPPRMWLPLVQK